MDLNLSEKVRESIELIRANCIPGETFATTSIQSQSLPLMHIISTLDFEIPIYFVDTGYHFGATLEFKSEVERCLGVALRTLRANRSKAEDLDRFGRPLYLVSPERCCDLNKVEPVEEMRQVYSCWVSGVRGDQTSIRAQMSPVMEWTNGGKRTHPMLHWTRQDIEMYVQMYNLPQHPLQLNNSVSLGCEPCTRLSQPAIDSERPSGEDRSGRWEGQAKTECGLHYVGGVPMRNESS